MYINNLFTTTIIIWSFYFCRIKMNKIHFCWIKSIIIIIVKVHFSWIDIIIIIINASICFWLFMLTMIFNILRISLTLMILLWGWFFVNLRLFYCSYTWIIKRVLFLCLRLMSFILLLSICWIACITINLFFVLWLLIWLTFSL
jgi:hypothetical protein